MTSTTSTSSTSLRGLYPPIEPHDLVLLDVGDGLQMYWEVCGNPAG